jgi:hypothetical protein
MTPEQEVEIEHAKAVVRQRLGTLSAGHDGRYPLDLTDFQHLASLKPVTTMIMEQGWRIDEFQDSAGSHVLQLKKPSDTIIPSNDETFLSGPPPSVLRSNANARAEAARIRAETGLDPLSDDDLSKARQLHRAARKRTTRWGWLGMLSGIVAFIGIIDTMRTTSADHELAIVPLVVTVVAFILCVVGFTILIRIEKQRRRALAPLRTYEQITIAALHSKRE